MTTKETPKVKRLPSDEHKLLVEMYRDGETFALRRPIDKLKWKGYISFRFDVEKAIGSWGVTLAGLAYLEAHGITAQPADATPTPTIPAPLAELQAAIETLQFVKEELELIPAPIEDTRFATETINLVYQSVIDMLEELGAAS